MRMVDTIELTVIHHLVARLQSLDGTGDRADLEETGHTVDPSEHLDGVDAVLASVTIPQATSAR